MRKIARTAGSKDHGPAEEEADRVRRVYSGYAGDARRQRKWAAENPGNVEIRNELLSHLLRLGRPAIEGSGRILDLGCGTGWALAALAAAGVAPERLVGVDIQPERVEAAQGAAPGGEFRVADARRPGLPPQGFSLILLLTLLSSLGSQADVRAVLRQARGLLCAGGLVLCYEPRIPNPFNRATRTIRRSDLAAAGLDPREELTLTVLPPLARRLGAGAPRWYPRLARVGLLRTHRLTACGDGDIQSYAREPGGG